MIKYCPYTSIKAAAIAVLAMGFTGLAHAADSSDANDRTSFVLVTEQTPTDDYQYIQKTRDNVTAVMLFGVMPNDGTNYETVAPYTPQLPQFIERHLRTAKNGLNAAKATFSEQNKHMDLYTGDESFFSRGINRGVDVERAKLAGMAMNVGKFTIGGGYTWDEENPAYLDQNEEGFIIGASYQRETWTVQTSFITTGPDLNVIGDEDRYTGYVVGGSYAPNPSIGFTAAMQYQQYDGDKTWIADNDVRFTVGTRIKF